MRRSTTSKNRSGRRWFISWVLNSDDYSPGVGRSDFLTLCPEGLLPGYSVEFGEHSGDLWDAELTLPHCWYRKLSLKVCSEYSISTALISSTRAR